MRGFHVGEFPGFAGTGRNITRRRFRDRIDMLGRGLRSGIRTLLGAQVRLVDRLLDFGVEGGQLGFGHDVFLDEVFAEACQGAALLPFLDLLLAAVAEIPHTLGMGTGAVSFAFDQRGPFPAARSLDRGASGGLHGQHVIPVNSDRGHAIGNSPRRDTWVSRGVIECHLGGIAIVLADKQDRQSPNAGHVDSFVECTIVDRAVAEKSHGHLVGFEQAEAVTCAGGLQNAGAHDPAGSEHADLGREKVHAPASSARTAFGPTIEFRDQLERLHPLGQSVTVPAVRAEDRIVRTQVGADSGRHRFLADVSMTRTVNESPLVRPGQARLNGAYDEHSTVEVASIGRHIRRGDNVRWRIFGAVGFRRFAFAFHFEGVVDSGESARSTSGK